VSTGNSCVDTRFHYVPAWIGPVWFYYLFLRPGFCLSCFGWFYTIGWTKVGICLYACVFYGTFFFLTVLSTFSSSF
jgi:hypothetical protein